MDIVELTKYTRFSGCGAKLGPGLLDKVLCGLTQPKYDNLITDYTTSDDAGIYKINDETALVQTLDFFPPIVDDPYTFGQIAAANSLSDVFAMGGKAITAMSIVCFPKDTLDIQYLKAIMDGALNKLTEAGAALVGGHSVDDVELKIGFSVTGTVHPDKVLKNKGIGENESLILTKKIGTGTINTALRAGLASPTAIDASIESMVTLNKVAAEVMNTYNVTSCTDVTGFGLGGHLCELIVDSDVGIDLDLSSIPLLPEVKDYLNMGLVPEGTYRNKEFRRKFIENGERVDETDIDLIFDPQTSGGLLFSISSSNAESVVRELKQKGVEATIIGNTNSNKEKISVR